VPRLLDITERRERCRRKIVLVAFQFKNDWNGGGGGGYLKTFSEHGPG
jgi:hypothetical protein